MMAEDFDGKVRCDFGVIEIEYPVSGGRVELAIRQGVSNKWAASIMTVTQARELMTMIGAACDAAEGKPARQWSTTEIRRALHNQALDENRSEDVNDG